MIIRVYKPPESDRQVIEKILVPIVCYSFDGNAADNGTDDLESYIAWKSSFHTDIEQEPRRVCRRCKGLEIAEVSLIYVKQRIAVRARDTLGLVRRDQSERAAAVRTAHSRGSRPTRLALCWPSISQPDVGKGHLLA